MHTFRSIKVELERPGSALSAIQNALVSFAERKDLSSAEGCMGLNAITEFGRQDADVTRISRDAARVLRQALMRVLTGAENQREIRSDASLVNRRVASSNLVRGATFSFFCQLVTNGFRFFLFFRPAERHKNVVLSFGQDIVLRVSLPFLWRASR
jgi:hypothetical protein